MLAPFFFFNDTATTEIYTLSLHDALPISPGVDLRKALWRFRVGMTYLSPAPLYHSAPCGSVALALLQGATVVVMEHFDAAQFLDLVGRYRVTRSQVVPTMFSRLLKLSEPVREAADISSLEVIINAPASRAWCQRAPREAE